MRRAAFSASLAVVSLAALAIASENGPRDADPFAGAAAKLSAGQLAGQRVIASYRGIDPPKSLVRMIRRGHVSGVIFFEENISSRAQIAAATRRLQRARRHSRLPRLLRTPLLLMVDQEGGQVRRLPGAPRSSQAQIGSSPRAGRAALKAGGAAARNLSSAGLNVNLAPVLDVGRRGGAIAQFGRSYGRKPGKVGRLGAAFIAAQQARGVAATAKHFPGMGAAAVNTDDAIVSINASRSRLRQVDEAPYADAIEAGVELVMLANAVYPALDRHKPAGLSRRIIEDELRRRAGFDGVVVTDALEAAGLREFGPVPKRGLRAARAGADLLLFSGRDFGHVKSGWRRLKKALKNGNLAPGAARAAARRVMLLRARLAGDEPS